MLVWAVPKGKMLAQVNDESRVVVHMEIIIPGDKIEAQHWPKNRCG